MQLVDNMFRGDTHRADEKLCAALNDDIDELVQLTFRVIIL